MKTQMRIEGIYDKRTLKNLKNLGIKHFHFDFSPKSLNFIQHHVFTEILELLDKFDTIYLHFSRSNDPMCTKINDELDKKKLNYIIECDEWSEEIDKIPYPHNLYFYNGFSNQKVNSFFQGLIIDYNILEESYFSGKLPNLLNQIYTSKNFLIDEKKVILKSHFNQNMKQMLIDQLDFDMITLLITDELEVCYRNVNIQKLNLEIEFIQKQFMGL